MIVGIDNGCDGGVVYLNKNEVRYMTMTKVKDRYISKAKTGNRICSIALYGFLSCLPKGTKVLIERPVGSKDLNAAKSMSDSFATIRTVCEVLNMEWVQVSASDWQKKLWKKGDPKEEAAKVFTKRFPKQVDNFKITSLGNKSKNLHDGLVDAILIADYGTRSKL